MKAKWLATFEETIFKKNNSMLQIGRRYSMKFKLNQVPNEHKDEFYKQLSCMNATRMITLFMIIASIEITIFLGALFFESNTEFIQKIMLIKLLFVALSLFFAVLLWLFKKYKFYKILRGIIILAVFVATLLAVANTLVAQTLVCDISIYIMALYIATAIIRISHIYYIIINSLCFIYFALGMQTAQSNAQFIKWSLINAIILNLIAVVIARILYSQTVEIFLDKIKIDRQLQTLQHMAEYDGLTNLYNHQTISRIIERQKELSIASKDKLCLAVIDIDNFKKINDQYGHIIGDQVLKGIAKKIKENVREQDYVARYGGDEFVILFPGVTVAEANKICKRILDSIRQVEPTESSITGSIGLIALTKSNYDDFIENADMKMYKAKNAGKGQIAN